MESPLCLRFYTSLWRIKAQAATARWKDVTLADVRGALARQGLGDADIRGGDALLFNFGWWRLWPDERVYINWPGIGKDVAEWVLERKASMVGSDAATKTKTHLLCTTT